MRYVAGILIAIGLIVLVFVIIFKVFTGGPSQPKKTPLSSYSSTGTTVQLLIDGPVVADQNHREVQINIGENQSQINVFKGYQNSLIQTKTYPNNSSAYGVFLRALDFAGFTNGKDDPSLADYRGYCPAGSTYIYQIIDGNNNRTQQYWGTSCGGQGTFQGSANSVSYLFEQQIPDYNMVTADLSL